MISIIFLTLKIFLTALFCGLGFTSIFLPNSLRKNGLLWLSFWFGLILIALLGVILSFGKVPMEQAKYIILLISLFFLIYGYLEKRISFNFSKIFWVIFLLTIVIFSFNIFPLIAKAGFSTTVSLGNLDPISYNTVADFFKTQTVFQGKELIFYKPYLWSVGDLVHYSFRWGSPLILSFFASIFNVRSYQVFSILLTLIFAMTYPLVCILAEVLNKGKNKLLPIIIFLVFGFNSTILYMLYNVFFAQFLFTGFFILMLIVFSLYLSDKQSLNLKFNSYDFLIGVIIASLSSVYPEGISFIFISWIIFLFVKMFTKDRFTYLVIFTKIILIALFINSFNMGTAINWNLNLFIGTTKTTWIGWEKIRYALPLEIMGFYNLYFSRNLPEIISFIFGLPIIFFWIIGVLNIKNRLLILSHLFTFILICFVYRFIYPNYFTFHKSITYSLFTYSILFAIGLSSILFHFKNKFITPFILMVITILTFRSAFRTISQLYYHPRIVDKSLVSLEKLNKNSSINEPFYTSDVFLGEYDLWKRLWREYLLSDKQIVTKQNITQVGLPTDNIKNILGEKNFLNYDNKELIYKKIVWKNEYYQLGEALLK